MRHILLSLIILVIAFLIYIYPLAVLAHLLVGSQIFDPITLIPTIAIALIIFTYARTHATSKWISGVTHYGLGIGFIALCASNLALLVAQFLPNWHVMLGILAGLTTIAGVIISLINGRRLHHKTITLPTDKLSAPIKLVFISDIHLGSNRPSHLAAICDQIARLDFEYLVIGGDLFDSSAFDPTDLEPLRQIRQPIYFVTGNHEYYVKGHAPKIESMRDYNIISLDNAAVQLGAMNMIGVSDNQPPHQQAEIAKSLTHPSMFNLLLVHQPGMWSLAPDNTDLMLSGHTHNGQIFPFNYLVRLQFKTVYGLFKRGTNALYVSSGSGTWGPRMRLGSRNEIVHITLSPR